MTISGLDILARTLSRPTRTDKHGNAWNYHSRSDHHSKVACWGIVFDLLRTSKPFREHVAQGRVGFGINVEMKDFQNDRSKDLDLLICQPATGGKPSNRTLSSLAEHYEINLKYSWTAAALFICMAPSSSLARDVSVEACPGKDGAATIGSLLPPFEKHTLVKGNIRIFNLNTYEPVGCSKVAIAGGTGSAARLRFVKLRRSTRQHRSLLPTDAISLLN